MIEDRDTAEFSSVCNSLTRECPPVHAAQSIDAEQAAGGPGPPRKDVRIELSSTGFLRIHTPGMRGKAVLDNLFINCKMSVGMPQLPRSVSRCPPPSTRNYKVLTGDIALRVRELMRQICEAFEIQILKGVVAQVRMRDAKAGER